MMSILNKFKNYCKQIYSGLKNIKHFRLSYIRKVFSYMGRREKIALALLAVAAVSSLSLIWSGFYYAHTMPIPSSGGSYTEGLLGQPNYINPLLAQSETDLSLTNIIFSGLYKYDGSGRLVPDLAAGLPVISQDQKQYTITLKPNLKWHNNRPLTADDVVFTVQTLKDPAYKSPLRMSFSDVSVEKLSDSVVRFTTKEISAPFIHNLTLPILPQNVWGSVPPQDFLLNEANLQPIGSGPYAVREIRKLKSGKVEQIILDSFPGYYGGQPKIDTITFRFYDTSDDLLNALHSREITGLGYVALEQSLYIDESPSEIQILKIPLPQYQVAFFNLNNKILSDASVRGALSLATDKQAIIDQVFQGSATLPSSPLLPGQSAPEPPKYDLAAAAAELDQAGWKIDPATGLRANKNVPFEITILTNDFLPDSQAADALAKQWRQLNIKVNLTVLTTQELTDGHIRPRNFDVIVFPQKFSGDPDPFVFWHSSQVRDPGSNISGFADPAADKLITEARTTTDPAARQQDYQQLDQLLSQEIPEIFLNQTEFVYAIDSSIKNIGLKTLYDPSQRFYDVANWYISEKRVWK